MRTTSELTSALLAELERTMQREGSLSAPEFPQETELAVGQSVTWMSTNLFPATGTVSKAIPPQRAQSEGQRIGSGLFLTAPHFEHTQTRLGMRSAARLTILVGRLRRSMSSLSSTSKM